MVTTGPIKSGFTHKSPGKTPPQFLCRLPRETSLEVEELLDEEGAPAPRVVQSTDRVRDPDATWSDKYRVTMVVRR